MNFHLNARENWQKHLSGLIKCGYCKLAINVVNGYKDKKYITCGGRKLRVCYDRKRTYLIEEIESAVATELLEEIQTKISSESSGKNEKESPEVNQLKIQLIKIDESIDGLLSKIPMANEVVMRYINDAVNKLDSEKKEILEKINLLSSKISVSVPMKTLVDAISNWDEFSFERKRKLAKAFIRTD